MMLELTIALGLASLACCTLFIVQAFLEHRELKKLKKDFEELEEMEF